MVLRRQTDVACSFSIKVICLGMVVGLTYQNKKYPGSSSSDLSCVVVKVEREDAGCTYT